MSTTPEQMQQVFDYIDKNVDKWIDNLAEAVAIKSVSAWTETRPEIEKMVRWVGNRLEKLGATIEYCDIGFQVMMLKRLCHVR
jgi:nonspecific dipeptidase